MFARNTLPCALLVLVATPFAAVAAESGAGELDREIRAVLAHYVGHWKGVGRFVGADGEPMETPGESAGRFILGGRFVERRSIDSAGGTLQIIGYDRRSSSYVSWLFGTDRAMFKATGKWHAGTRTMFWTGTTYREFRFAAEETHDEDRLSGQWQASDQEGRILVRGTSEDRRVATNADPELLEKALRVAPSSSVRELRAMQDLVGAWRETLGIEVDGRETVHGAGVYSARWILGGAAQLWEGRHQTPRGAGEYLWVFTFDEQRNEHRAWWFSSSGAVVEYAGGPAPGSSAWEWTAQGMRAGIRQTVTIEVTGPSQVESTTEVTRGASLRGIRRATSTRDASPAN